ncbi:MAG TPA: contractile injection system protein, VgrG/Pvc8 family [Planctomycetota bacterium]|nr:contractile injection system protein, VgrG/Pvc8 family [Planctomycetota bacterium]
MDLADRLVEFELTDSDNKTDTVRFVLRNDDLYFFQNDNVQLYSRIVFSWGYTQLPAPPRAMTIRRIKGGGHGAQSKGRAGDVEVRRDFNVFEISGASSEVRFNDRHRKRVYKKKKASQIARQIARDFGFKPENILVTDTKAVYEEFSQGTESDAAFLVRLAAAEGFQWYVDESGFFFGPRDYSANVSHVLRWRDDPFGTIMGVEIEEDVRAPVGVANVCGYDRNRKRCYSSKEDRTTSADGTKDTANGAMTLTHAALIDAEIPEILLFDVTGEVAQLGDQFNQNAQILQAQAGRMDELKEERARVLELHKEAEKIVDAIDLAGANTVEDVIPALERAIAVDAEAVAPSIYDAIVSFRKTRIELENINAELVEREKQYATSRSRAESFARATGHDVGTVEDGTSSEHNAAAAGTTVDKIDRHAKRNYRKANQDVVKLTVTVVGDPTIRAKSTISLRGIGQRLDGVYYARMVKHKVTPAAYTTEIYLVGNSAPGGVKPVDTTKAKKPDEEANARIVLVHEAGTGGLTPALVDAEGNITTRGNLQGQSDAQLAANEEFLRRDDKDVDAERAADLLKHVKAEQTRRVAKDIADKETKRRQEQAKASREDRQRRFEPHGPR